jgi:hypothetical protein
MNTPTSAYTPTPEMVTFFEQRTKEHIKRVRKCLSDKKMLDFSGPRWSQFTAGYRVPVYLRPLLNDLEK